MPSKNERKTEGRAPDGKFCAGNTLGRGRPQGSRNRATQAAQALLDGEAESLTQTAVSMALQGDIQALRLCLERLLPPCKERALPEITLPQVATAADLPRLTAAILQAVATGGLTPGEAEKVASLAVSHGRVLEVAGLEARIAALEASNE